VAGWLREFEADGAGLAAGNALHGTVVPLLPYRLRLDIRLQRCDRPRSVQAAVGGDLSGRAVLRLEDADGGTRVAVAWPVEMRSLPLRLAARMHLFSGMLGHIHLCPRRSPRGGLGMAATALPGIPAAGQAAGGDMLMLWAEATGRRRAAGHGPGGLRCAFHGRVSTEDSQEPVTSGERQRDQAAALVARYGRIVAEFFGTGYSRTLAWARRPQAAALVAALADPDRGWDAVVIGEYERAFYGGQYASMASLFEHYGIQLWTPEVGGRIDFHAEDHEQTMLALGLQSKREIARTRTRIRVRTAMATQTREQGRYLGGRPPYGYRLADAGPHANRVHAGWGRRAHRLEPDPAGSPAIRA
jgi:hypothetical protein